MTLTFDGPDARRARVPAPTAPSLLSTPSPDRPPRRFAVPAVYLIRHCRRRGLRARTPLLPPLASLGFDRVLIRTRARRRRSSRRGRRARRRSAPRRPQRFADFADEAAEAALRSRTPVIVVHRSRPDGRRRGRCGAEPGRDDRPRAAAAARRRAVAAARAAADRRRTRATSSATPGEPLRWNADGVLGPARRRGTPQRLRLRAALAARRFDAHVAPARRAVPRPQTATGRSQGAAGPSGSSVLMRHYADGGHRGPARRTSQSAASTGRR